MFMLLCDMNGLVSGFNFRTREMAEKMLIDKKKMNMEKKSSDTKKRRRRLNLVRKT